MFNTIEEYLNALKKELRGCDSALIQDALADAHEHLFTALEAARETDSTVHDAEALKRIIEEYGSPEETASAYREVERRTSPALKREETPKPGWLRFLAVYSDPRAWGAVLYMLIAYVTGIIYFVWAVMGLSFSVAFSLFIFGLPLAILFLLSVRGLALLSVRGLALLEGRIVEALLGVRMPRRPLFTGQGLKWMDRLKQLLTDKRTWLSLLYMLLQFVLGTIYFILFTLALSLSLSLIAIPALQETLREPFITWDYVYYFLPTWSYPIVVILGILLWTTYMNLARGIGQLHAKMAKWMLVAEG